MRRPVQLVLIAAALLTACEPGEITLVRPDDGSVGTALEIHVTLEDPTLAGTLGWTDGVPGVTAEWAFVHYRRYIFHDAVSDGGGTIAFEPEGRGWHWVAAEKYVEMEGERRALAGGAKATGSAELTLKLDDPGTLVISEIYMDSPPPWEGGNYDGSRYIELYNNSAEVLYLDGMVLGKGYDIWYDLSRNGLHSCAYTGQYRDDSKAVWSDSHWRFPGTGTDHPIAPGEAVVVAVSAADHTAVHPSMMDLSAAEFEFAGGGQSDNPAAANMENVSSDYGGRQEFLISRAFWFISTPVDLLALPVLSEGPWRSGNFIDHWVFPADAVLDAVIVWWDTTESTVVERVPPCEDPTHPSFDALPGGYLYGSTRPEDLLVSPQRKIVRMDGGRSILQDTNTSAVDFENRERTPGWIPGG